MSATSDKLHQRRKSARDFKRKQPSIEPQKRILIVCEGEVTEVDYFENVRSISNLSNVDIEICGKECGSSPTSVVKFALDRSKVEGPQDLGGYDKVFCVFDRDSHPDFERAKGQIIAANKPRSTFRGGSIEAIWSVPCFEVWLVMHFSNSRAPYAASGGLSVGQSVTRALRAHSPFESFEKRLNAEQLKALNAHHATAMKHAKAAYADYQETGEPNPSTNIFILITEILR